MQDVINRARFMMARFVIPRNILFLFFNLITFIIFYTPLKALIALSLSSDDLYSHIIIIPLISGYFIYLKRKEIASNIRYSLNAGIILITIGLILYLIGVNQKGVLNQNDYLSLTIFSLVVSWIGGFILFYGVQAFREAIFPILLLIFMIPVPGLIIDTIIFLLQKGSTEVAYAFLRLTGIPVFREGFLFHLPGISIEVAKECSGIRSSIGLLITSLMAGHLFLKTGWRKSILSLSVFPIAIVKNGLRIVTLSLLAVYVDERILSSALHHKGGIVFFIPSLFFLWLILSVLRKSEKGEKRLGD